MNETTNEEIALILRNNTAWSPQAGCYIIHGAIEKLIEKIDQEKRSTAIAFSVWTGGPDCEYSMTDE